MEQNIIYPQQYFPTSEINQEVLNGRFPPDITGEYEMIGDFVDGYYEYYNQQTHQYQVLPSQAYPVSKTMYIIIENQVNGMAKIRFSLNGEWFDSNAYIFGDVYSYNNTDFVVLFENTQGTDAVKYFRGNILKGKISAEGIQNITTWSVIKDRQFSSLVYGIYNLGGHEQYHADFAGRKK